MSVTHSAINIKNAGQKAAESHPMEILVRIGYGVRGVLYIMMGFLALQVVIGKGDAPSSQSASSQEVRFNYG